MKCFSRSTRSSASRIAAALALGVLTVAAAGAGDDPIAMNVRQAVHAAVTSRMGDDTAVSVESLTALRLVGSGDGLVATPDTSGKTGRPVRFTITARTDRGRSRIGEVTAVVTVTTETVRTTRPVARGAVLTAGDLRSARETLVDAPLRPVPTLSTAIGARMTRDLASGVPVGPNDILAERIVTNNSTVRAVVKLGTAEIEADVVALDAGARGDIIRVTNVASRRVFRARVTGKGRVEVLEP